MEVETPPDSTPLLMLKDRLCRRDYRIIKLRVLKRLSQRAIARRMGLTQQRISYIIIKVRRMAAALNVQLRDPSKG